MSIFNGAKKMITRLLMDDLRQNIGDVIVGVAQKLNLTRFSQQINPPEHVHF